MAAVKEESDAAKAAREKKAAAAAAAVEHEARLARLPKCDNVVPGSAKRLAADSEYVLMSVVLFKKGVDDFKAACRQERYTVRSHEFTPDEEKATKDANKKIEKKHRQLFGHLLIWPKTYFSDLFAAWVHIKVMRCFVEAVLRYGLPDGDQAGGNVDHQYFLLQPKASSGDKCRKQLENLYGHLGGADLGMPAGDEGAAIESAFGEFYSYVCLDFAEPTLDA
jgi:V-type H+-transporting ATPase subunit C